MAVVVQAGTSALSNLAVDRAVEEATLRDVPLVLVSQVAMPRHEAEAASYQARREEVDARLVRHAHELGRRGIVCRPYMPNAPSSPADAVLAAAREHEAALIVVGARRRTPVGKALLGSTAQDILLGAGCPVLVVKLPPEGEVDP